jgi:hypothetical protein
MKYLWTEDKGAGLHFWNLANQYLFKDCCVLPTSNEKYCNLPLTDGDDKFKELINDSETQRVVAGIIPKPKNQ